MNLWERIFGIGYKDPPAFADLLVKRGRAAGILEAPTVDYERFQIKSEGLVFYLGNHYGLFLQLGRRERAKFVDHLVEMMNRLGDHTLPETFEEARPMLLPRLRHRVFFELLKLKSVLEDSEGLSFEQASQPLCGDLHLAVVVDSDQAMAFVNDNLLAEWGVSFEEALEAAEKNLIDRSLDSFKPVASGLWLGPWQDSYAASRILFPHLLQKVTKDPVVCAPSRDVLLLATPQPQALETLISVLEREAEEERYPLTRQLFKLENKELVPWELPPDQPRAWQHRRLLARERAGNYQEQQSLLQDLEGDEPYVASLLYFEGQDPADDFSCSTWTRGAPTLLPKADRVMFVIPSESGAPLTTWEVPWEDVEAEGLVTPTDYHPPRFLTSDFPPEELLEHIGQQMEAAPGQQTGPAAR